MNKKILLPVMALALTLTACDMDKTPYDSIPDSEALQTPTDFENQRNSLYSGLQRKLQPVLHLEHHSERHVRV